MWPFFLDPALGGVGGEGVFLCTVRHHAVGTDGISALNGPLVIRVYKIVWCQSVVKDPP